MKCYNTSLNSSGRNRLAYHVYAAAIVEVFIPDNMSTIFGSDILKEATALSDEQVRCH